jgi:hypothetical protein
MQRMSSAISQRGFASSTLRSWKLSRGGQTVSIAELGEDNLFHLGPDGLEPITMVLVEFRRGRPLDDRLTLGRKIVDICVDVLNLPRKTVVVEFTSHSGDEILRDGNWVGEWTAAEGSAQPRIATASGR